MSDYAITLLGSSLAVFSFVMGRLSTVKLLVKGLHNMTEKSPEINLFSPLGLTILVGIVAPIFVVVILALYFPKTWNDVITRLGIASDSNVATQPTKINTPPLSGKTPELMEVLDTPAGVLPVVKYRGDNCLYAKATTAHTKYYGENQLKDQLKQRYQVNCVFWD